MTNAIIPTLSLNWRRSPSCADAESPSGHSTCPAATGDTRGRELKNSVDVTKMSLHLGQKA